jgi:hypothetical protein
MRNVMVDQAILACCGPQLRKVARIIGDVAKALELPSGSSVDFIADRIKALVKAKKLEGAGNLDRWHFSEIRLPEKSPPSALGADEGGAAT